MKSSEINSIQNPYAEILREIEEGLWEHDVRVDEGLAGPYSYNDDAFLSCCKIFMSAMVWKQWVFMDGKSLAEREAMSEKLGTELRALILAHTGIDLHKVFAEIHTASEPTGMVN